MHSVAFDAKGQIWTFVSWGRPFRLVTPALDGSFPDSTPVQVECGWTFCVALMDSGDVYAWWPFDQEIVAPYEATMATMNEQGDKRAQATTDGKIPCATWDLIYNPVRLPSIDVRRLPELSDSQDEGSDQAPGINSESVKLVKIAAADNTLIGLTNAGHVLKLDHLERPQSARTSQWEYVSFCDITQ